MNGISAVSYMVLFIALARGLSPSAMGEYYTLFALILVVQLVCEMGIPTVMTARIARASSAMRETLSQAAAIGTVSIAADVAVFAGLGVAAHWLSPHPGATWRFLLAGCAAAAIQVQRYSFGVFRAFEMFRYENTMRLGQGLTLAATVIALIKGGVADLNLMVAVLAGSHILSALYMIVNVQRQFRCIGWRWDRERIKDWLRESIPLGISESIRGQGWQLDTVLLGLLQPPAIVGIYSAAYRPLSVFYWLPVAATAAVFPTFVRLASDRRQFSHAVANSVRMLWIGALPAAVVISLAAEGVVRLLAGDEYLEAALPMRLLVWKMVFASMAILYRFVFAAVGELPAFARIVLAAVTIDAAAELIMIPFWGYLGACWGTLLGEFAFTTMTLLLCRKLDLHFVDWSALSRAALAAAIMAAVLWPVHRAPLIVFLPCAAVAGLLYLACCVLLGALTRTESLHFFEAFGLRRNVPPADRGTIENSPSRASFALEDVAEKGAGR